jgi:Flp pilus assembly protein TadG
MGARPVARSAGHHRHRLANEESGVVAIEFALTLPLILLALFAIIEFGQVFNNLNDVNQIAANGARMAAVNTAPPGAGTLQAYLESQADTKGLKKDINVCVQFPSGTSSVGDPVQVVATSDYHLVPLLGGATLHLHGEATMRLERVPSTYTADC